MTAAKLKNAQAQSSMHYVAVMVLEVQGNQVRLGIPAPREIAVHREELYKRVQAEKNKQECEKEPDKKDLDNIYNR